MRSRFLATLRTVTRWSTSGFGRSGDRVAKSPVQPSHNDDVVADLEPVKALCRERVHFQPGVGGALRTLHGRFAAPLDVRSNHTDRAKLRTSATLYVGLIRATFSVFLAGVGGVSSHCAGVFRIAAEVSHAPPSKEDPPYRRNRRAPRSPFPSNLRPTLPWPWPTTQKAEAASASLLSLEPALYPAGPWDGDGVR